MDETNKLEQLLQESHEPSSFINQALKDYSPSFPENLQNYCNDLYSKLLVRAHWVDISNY